MIRLHIIKASSQHIKGKTIGVFLSFNRRPIRWTIFHRVPGCYGWQRL